MSNPHNFTAEAAEETATVDPLEAVVATSVGGYQVLGILVHVVSQTHSFESSQKIHAYVSINGLFPLIQEIEKINGKPEDPKEALMALHPQVSDANMKVVRAIVLKTIEAGCFGFISKQSKKDTFPDVFNYFLRMIVMGYYWFVVKHAMAEFVIECDDKTVNRTFFEQKMLELVKSSE
jgi:hypothetical protein